MRTTLDLPENLIEEAMKVAHMNTKTKVIKRQQFDYPVASFKSKMGIGKGIA